MEISIIGLPKSGKTTIFNTLTKSKVHIDNYSSASITPNLGISKVPEPRLKFLEKIYQPKKTTLAEIKYADIVGMAKGFGKDEGIRGKFLNYLSTADAIIQVIRTFKDNKIPCFEDKIDPRRDLATMELELVFSDLIIIERRLKRIEDSLKGAKSSERDIYLKEQAVLQKIKTGLEKEIPIWQQNLASDETRQLYNYQFLTAKPILVIVNIDEDEIGRAASIENELRSVYSHPKFEVIALCGKLEMELAQLTDVEAREFRNSMGLAESAVNRVIRSSYKLLGLISFFTTVSSELRVWTIPADTNALRAAGKIHTDMERGFIKAEVISYQDIERYGNLGELRKHGLLRLEGKNYFIQDGDIITFLFNV